MHRLSIACAFTLVAAGGRALADEALLENDTVPETGMVNLNWGTELDVGEGLAETFEPPAHYYPFTIKKVRFIASNKFQAGKANVTFKIYEDAGAATPGKQLASWTEKEIEGTNMAWQDVDAPPTLIDKGKVRVAFFPDKRTTGNDSGLVLGIDTKSPPGQHTTVCINAGATCSWTFLATVPGAGKGTWTIRLLVEIPTGANPKKDGGSSSGGDGGGASGDAPVVDSITPGMAVEGMSVSAVILGKNFVTAAPGSKVLLDTKLVTDALVMDDRTIRVTTPKDLPAGSYDVVVQNPNGAIGRLPKGFSVALGRGCGCVVGGAPIAGGPAAALALLLLLLVGWRRRR